MDNFVCGRSLKMTPFSAILVTILRSLSQVEWAHRGWATSQCSSLSRRRKNKTPPKEWKLWTFNQTSRFGDSYLLYFINSTIWHSTYSIWFFSGRTNCLVGQMVEEPYSKACLSYSFVSISFVVYFVLYICTGPGFAVLPHICSLTESPLSILKSGIAFWQIYWVFQ